jgi:hypothetical protein
MRKAPMLIPAAAVAVIAIAAVVREHAGASKSPAATRDGHTTAMEASGRPAGAAVPGREAMASREVERQDAATVQVAASSMSGQSTIRDSSSPPTGRKTGGEAAAPWPTDAADSATPKTSARALTEEVNELFFVKDYCNVTSGGDEKLRQRCHRAGALADQIVNVPKTSADSWAYGMESEIDRHLTELSRPGAGWGVVERKEVRCHALGCVVYMEGPARWGYSFARLVSAIDSDPLIAQLNEQSQFPGPGAWDQKVNDRAMLVLPRR